MFDYAKLDENTVYEHVVNYEKWILGSSFSAADKKIILTASSVSRYAYTFAKRHKRRPKDRDWELLVGNIVAGTYTASDDITAVVRMAVLVNLSSNLRQ